MRSLSSEWCLDILSDLIEKGEGSKITLWKGTLREAEMWRIRIHRALKKLPEQLRRKVFITRNKIDEDEFELFIEYIKESSMPRFKITDADGNVSYTKTPAERRTEKLQKQDEINEKESVSNDDFSWNDEE